MSVNASPIMTDFRFGEFTLDPADRQLRRHGAPVDLNGRYLDALTLLVRERGKLVTKDRFMDEVWRGVPVTDEALTQCIKTLRRQLGDPAAAPRFIETVPKHGYRFIAPVEAAGADLPPARSDDDRWRDFFVTGISGSLGGGVAGMLGGLFYGFAATSQPLQPGVGAVSMLLVLVCITALLALIGAAGVSFGIAAARLFSRSEWQWSLAGGALGGLVVGAVVKLIGTDAFNLLLGQSPGDITGAAEGALLGAGVGLGAWLAGRLSLRRGIPAAALVTSITGIFIAVLGGRLMAGSLDLLARQFPESRLRLDPLGALAGESGLGPVAQTITACLEGLLFGGCVVGAMLIARRRFLSDR